MPEQKISIEQPRGRKLEILQELEKVSPLVTGSRERFKDPRIMYDDLLPRAIMHVGIAQKIKGTDIALILQQKSIPGTYGSLKVLVHRARQDALKENVAENPELAGLHAFIGARIGEDAAAKLLEVAKNIVDETKIEKAASQLHPQSFHSPVIAENSLPQQPGL